MKNIIILSIIFIYASSFSQGPGGQFWRKGGNNAIPNNNIIGTNNTWNSSFVFHTFGIQRMQINDNTGPNAGFIGIGNSFTNPNNLLDVDGGDIDVNTSQRSYMIGDQSVLWHKGSATNIFVGVGAGNSHQFNAARHNTFIGYNAGFLSTGSGGPVPPQNEFNVLIGSHAGYSHIGSYATIVGAEAGYNAVGDDGATFIGFRAGYTHNSIAGTGNTFIGLESGYSTNALANDNTFVGSSSGKFNTSGDNNCFFGLACGENSTIGMRNCFFGNVTGQNNGSYNNNSYYGFASGIKSTGDNNSFYGAFSGQGGVGDKNVIVGNNGMANAITGNNENVAIGFQTILNGNGDNFNTVLGSQSAINLSKSEYNTLIGYKTAFFQSTGTNNTYLGVTTGNNVQTGNDNTFIGANSDATNITPVMKNATAIGSNAKVTNDNHMILGDNNVNVGIGLSGDPLGPQNKLEINTIALTSSPGASGLRFRDLTSASTPQIPNNLVLSVDPNGDVIIVPDQTTGNASADNGLSYSGPTIGSIHFGQDPGASGDPGKLLNDREIPMNNYNIGFTEPVTGIPGENTIKMGRFLSLQSRVAKLTVSNNNLNSSAGTYNQIVIGLNASTDDKLLTFPLVPLSYNPLYFTNIANKIRVGVLATGVEDPSTGSTAEHVIGVSAAGVSNSAANVIGISSKAYSQGNATFVSGIAISARGTILTTGVKSTSQGVGTVYGGEFGASGGTNNYGIFATAPSSGGISGPNYAGFFNGDLVYTGSFGMFSDRRLKEDVQEITNAWKIISRLNPVTYNFKVNDYKNLNLSHSKQYGFIAQEVMKILPDLTLPIVMPARYDSIGNEISSKQEYIGLNYINFIAILTQGIKEQQKQIEDQNNRITKLEKMLEQNGNSLGQVDKNSKSQFIDLSNSDIIILNQNSPNPFAEKTTITYNIPERHKEARVKFATIEGIVLKEVNLDKKGNGQLNVFASDLSSGVYIYSLIVDGKIIESKKMIKD